MQQKSIINQLCVFFLCFPYIQCDGFQFPLQISLKIFDTLQMTDSFSEAKVDFSQSDGASSPKSSHFDKIFSETVEDSEDGLRNTALSPARHRKPPKCAPYNWSDYENKKYVQFLAEFQKLLQLPPKERKLHKLNLKMSRRIKTRNHVQCRTHHQKMMEKFGSVGAIIQSYHYLLHQKRKRQPLKRAQNEEALEEGQNISQWKTVDQILERSLLPDDLQMNIRRQAVMGRKSIELMGIKMQEEQIFEGEHEDDLFGWTFS